MKTKEKFVNWVNEKKEKSKSKKVRRADLNKSIQEIKELQDKAMTKIKDITAKLDTLDPNSEEVCMLKAQLAEQNQLYSEYQDKLTKAYNTLKEYGKSGVTDKVVQYTKVGSTIFLSVVTLGLNRENPTIMKALDWVTKPFRSPDKFS